MTIKPSIEDLEDKTRFEKVRTLPYGDIAPFVIGRFSVADLPMILLWIFLLFSASMTVWFWPGLRFDSGDPHVIKGLITGLVLIPLLSIPVHEALHLIPFYFAGARNIRIGADLKQGIVYITAHRFVADGRLFSLVALTPFAVITSAAFISIITVNPWWQWVISLSLVAHTSMCTGDAAMVSYTKSFRTREFFTWDDTDSREAYFYVARQH